MKPMGPHQITKARSILMFGAKKIDPCLYFNISEKKQLDVPECKMYFEFELKIR